MADGQTIAEAEGNTAALAYTFITKSPDATPFETEMTPEMIDKHKYYNDDILEIAEKMAQSIKQLEQAKAALAKVETNITRFEAAGGSVQRGGKMVQARLSALDYVKRSEAAIAQYEKEIEAEIEEVRTEYRRLAENLNDRAEAYRRDYDGLRRFQDDELRTAMSLRRDLTEGGADPEDAARVTQARTEDGYYSFHVKAYAVTWGDYRLLQEGFAITTTREAVMSVVWGAAELIALEIITAGLITTAAGAVMATRIGSKVVGAAARVAARVGDDVLKLIIKRYNALPDGVKTKLDDIFERLRVRRERDYKKDGPTGEGSEPSNASINCLTKSMVGC
ncbi:hypothetical protein [Paracoccus sp. (in: a-proteobacteria)]|uniref:hypothetical protein n=1 Tax=Paracoccus sp. TaxID=267 RepID=UPI003A8C31F5